MKNLNKLIDAYSDNEKALSVINALQDGRSLFLTGKAGTGKSYLLNQIRKQLDDVIMLAPTGLTAINVKGQTIHSFFKLSLRPFLPNDNELEKLTGDRRKLVRKAKLIIIDEISMVRVDIFSAFNKVLQLTMSNTLPFGGKQVLVVGDLYQLPPVVTSNEKDIIEQNYKSEFFFDADGLQNTFEMVELDKVYRQSDPLFIRILDTMRVASITAEQLAWVNERVVKQADEESITIATTNKIANTINASQLAALPDELHSFEAKITGRFEESGTMPAEVHLDIKVGSQIMMTNNANDEDGNSRWQNGTLGKVVEITDDIIKVKLNDRIEDVERHTWESYEYKWNAATNSIEQEVTGTFTQFPIKLAWAVTIHKSQGLTFDKVNIDLGWGAFSAGQTYVAMSRCRTFEGVSVKQPIKLKDIFVNDAVKQFMTQAI